MWEQIAVTVGIKTVEKLFEGMSQKDPGTVAVGLAVGYYYNFLDPVSEEIQRDEFKLYASENDSAPQTFQAEDVRVQIIVPSRLSVQAFQRCEEEFKASHKGLIFLKRNQRFYGVNYSLTQLPEKRELTIIDLARPLMSAKRYYEDVLKQDTHDDANEKWVKNQIAEIAAFKEAIRRLQKRGYGGLVNKLDFRERA